MPAMRAFVAGFLALAAPRTIAGQQHCGASSDQCSQSDDVQLLQRPPYSGQVSQQTLGTSPNSTTPPPKGAVLPEYDCDFDGVDDCGKWDYQYGMCANQERCHHQYKFPDGTLDQSCRCKLCDQDPTNVKSAFSDSNLRDGADSFFGGALYWGSFRNWADHMSTCAPWLMPKDDDGIRTMLTYAINNGYKVRISGAGHSSGGLVTDGENNQVFVISLAEYVAPDEWEFSVSTMPDGSQRAKVNAGWSQADLYQKVRPQGNFLPAQTAGYFFQLGGIVSNSVHGGSYLHGFQHAYTTQMRVMTYDGQIRIVDSEEELRYWRCSFGLLGIILGIEYQLEKREQLQMYAVSSQFVNGWNEKEFWRIIMEEAEANIPEAIVPVGGLNGSRASWNGEYFFDFINGGEKPKVMVYSQKANSSVDAAMAGFTGELGVPAKVVENYEKLMSTRVESRTGHKAMSWGESARRDGAPPIKILGRDVNGIIHDLGSPAMARIMSEQALTSMPDMIKSQSKSVNDGFFLKDAPAALAAAYFVKPEDAFKSMDFLRSVQLASLKSKDFVWNLPGEARFVNVTDSAVLQPVPAGLWFCTEMISFPDMAKDVQAWRRELMKVEKNWTEVLGAKPHAAKLYGFGESANGDIEPFQDSFTCSIFSDAQKQKFNAYRKTQDPDGLFATGLGMKFLQPCKA